MLGPFATASRFTLPFTRCRYCRTPPVHGCPRQRPQQQRQRQRGPLWPHRMGPTRPLVGLLVVVVEFRGQWRAGHARPGQSWPFLSTTCYRRPVLRCMTTSTSTNCVHDGCKTSSCRLHCKNSRISTDILWRVFSSPPSWICDARV